MTPDLSNLLKEPMGWVLARLALRYLTSSTRMLLGEKANTGAQDEFRRPFTSLKRDAIFEQEFTDMVLSSDLGWAREDLDAALRLLKANCTSLLDWLEVLWRGFGLEVEIDGRAPVIPMARVREWAVLTDWMDPDVLVCWQLARRREHERCASFDEWGPITRLFDREVESVLKDGVSDLHVHLGGLRTANLLWLRVVAGRTELAQVPYYAPGAVERRARATSAPAEAYAERDRIEELVEYLNNPASTLGRLWDEAASDLEEATAGRPRFFTESVLALVMRERAMLARAFFALENFFCDFERAEKMRATTRDEPWHWPPNPLEDWLDRYVFAKSKFIRRHRQPAETNPGLAAFQTYFKSTDLWGGKRLRRTRSDVSPGVVAQTEFEDLAAYLSQCPHLRRVELRVGPAASALDYHMAFEAWALVEERFALTPRMDVRFAVHLKRSADARSQRELEPGETPVQRFLREIDRETAVLHKFRTDPAWVKHAWRIARIDLAGRERDSMPDLAAFCMKLARGERNARKALDDHADDKIHRFWMHERALEREREGLNGAINGRFQRLEVPPLGITCHAGEDFAQPFEGLFAIDSAAKLLGLREGDTIGHALAAGTDAVAFYATKALRRLTQRGAQFDAFLWAFFELRALRTVPGDALQELAVWLRKEMNDIYPGSLAFVPAVTNLDDLSLERAKPAYPSSLTPSGAAARLRHMEIWNASVADVRVSPVPLCEYGAKFAPFVSDLQKKILSRLSEKGVILEFNPSSNLRISASQDIESVPFVRIIKQQGNELYATINTDNPGTFGTRIENEYALMFQALRNSKMRRDEIMATLDRMRRHGMRNVYWPDTRPHSD